jgi:hypothetical protein
MPNLGAADNRSLTVMVAVECGRALARTQWPGRCATPPAQARGLSSLKTKERVRWKHVRRRCSSGIGWYALLDAATQVSVSRIILDWVHGLLMAVVGNVMVLSSIKIGAPASKEGT